MEYVTIEGVELVTAGMKWPTSTGEFTFTLENLADAVEAANNDPHVLAPRLKLGHTDSRFEPPDGEPAFGRAENLRLENDGAVIVADFVEVPAWLADAMPSAYPNRSIEANYDVTTQGGRHYSFVMTAVALLGIYWPAVSDLEDLERLLTEGPDMSEVTDGELAKAMVAAGSGVQAAADAEKVIDTFYSEVATADADRYWWWCRAVWTDPNELIVDDDEGHLYRVPFSSDDAGVVTFDEPQEVRQQFVDIASGEQVAATKREGAPQAVFASRSADGLPQREKPQPAASRPENEEDTMDPKEIRERLGLAEDATDEQCFEKLDELNGSTETTEETETEETTETEKVEEPVAAGKPTIEVDQGVWEETQRQAKEGAAARAEQLTVDREKLLGEAVKAGKIAPASKDAWREKLVATPEATKAEIEKLPAGLLPVDGEVGASQVPDGAQLSKALSAFGINRG